ncbi:hypothetical protein N864_05830 [Intrasporangium chromatireducens Q5-1]|uniref:Uncharacterized protein n=1 Tax=Intrasporangium chromatireducens Q5-1 TaxID=584657 RepID=W9GLP6_9MICO|nr:hypothetical protein [Intrasporangium chromatireducens]EWT04829.1 hypothetical protein N864_05830 [Intrasporangium chromatireducens Q5-1]
MSEQDIKAAAQEPDRYEAQAAEWAAEAASASVELQAAESSSGADVLDEPEAAAGVVERIAKLRARVEVAQKAQGEAKRRAHAARVRGAEAEAAALDPAIAKARKALEQHLTKRGELLKALEEFSNAEWRMRTFDDGDIQDRVARGERVTLPTAVEWRLQRELGHLQERQTQLRDVAAQIAADPEWVPPQEAHRDRMRAEWARVVEQYRGWLVERVEAEAEVEHTAQTLGFDLEDAFIHEPQWLRDLRARIEELTAKVALFPQDVEFYGRQMRDAGGSLGDVDELLVEFGLKEPEPEGEDDEAQLPVGA